MKETIDYSKKENWFQIPEITKDVDTFYIYATEYIMGSLMEGAPEYASLDNEEMLQGAAGEYLLHATAYADSTNVFMPYYRYGEDYALFYNNIKDNVAKRIAAYKANVKTNAD